MLDNYKFILKWRKKILNHQRQKNHYNNIKRIICGRLINYTKYSKHIYINQSKNKDFKDVKDQSLTFT